MHTTRESTKKEIEEGLLFSCAIKLSDSKNSEDTAFQKTRKYEFIVRSPFFFKHIKPPYQSKIEFLTYFFNAQAIEQSNLEGAKIYAAVR